MGWWSGVSNEGQIREEVGALVNAGLMEPYIRGDGMPGLRRSRSAAEAGLPKPHSQMEGDPDGK
jgi:hypothetical protein